MFLNIQLLIYQDVVRNLSNAKGSFPIPPTKATQIKNNFVFYKDTEMTGVMTNNSEISEKLGKCFEIVKEIAMVIHTYGYKMLRWKIFLFAFYLTYGYEPQHNNTGIIFIMGIFHFWDLKAPYTTYPIEYAAWGFK